MKEYETNKIVVRSFTTIFSSEFSCAAADENKPSAPSRL